MKKEHLITFFEVVLAITPIVLSNLRKG